MNIDNISELKKFKRIDDDYGSGALIYKLNELDALKVFKTKLSLSLENRFNNLKDIKTNNFSFPTENLYINNQLRGYKMNFKRGKMFNVLDNNIDIKNILIALKKLDRDLHILDENGVKIFDLHGFNILFDEDLNNINIIDVDEYGLYSNNTYLYNLKCVIYRIIKYLNLYNFDINDISNINNFINKLYKEINIMQDICKFEIKTKKDIRKYNELKVLNKRL